MEQYLPLHLGVVAIEMGPFGSLLTKVDLHEQDATEGKFSKQNLTGLNSEFSFS